MTSPEMDFITLVALEPQASQSESTPVLQENITAHLTRSGQRNVEIWRMWKMKVHSVYSKANCNELNVILWSHYEIKNEVGK